MKYFPSLFALLGLAALAPAQDHTALDRYVAAPDEAYKYEVTTDARALGLRFSVLDLTSQKWLTTAEVDRTEWRHWLSILRPERTTGGTAVLVISGGDNPGSPPTLDLQIALFAAEVNGVVAELRMVPNQPLQFADESVKREEDALIAYSWDKFLKTGDERWPARLPMTKAVVRAMDAITDFLASERGGGVKVDRFIVIGASKRGWTAWSTAAVDQRVVGVVPVVIDVLNVQESLRHHGQSYGFWSRAIRDYERAGIMKWFDTPQIEALLDIEDPYRYRDRLALPKYLVNSTGDQFFLPDSSRFYFDDLPGEKYLRYVPNTDHSLEDSDAILGILAYVQGFLTCTPRPRFSWKADREQGTIRLRTMDPPSEVRLWKAANPKARDFRLETIGKAWTSEVVTGEKGIYQAKMAAPEEGFAAFFLEMTYPSGGRVPWKFTTEVVVVPDVYPFDVPPVMTEVKLEGQRRPRSFK